MLWEACDAPGCGAGLKLGVLLDQDGRKDTGSQGPSFFFPGAMNVSRAVRSRWLRLRFHRLPASCSSAATVI